MSLRSARRRAPLGVSFGTCGVLALLVVAASAPALPASPAHKDELPPILLQHEPELTDEGVRLRVQVVDPSGVGTVTLHVLEPGADAYTAVPMSRAGGNDYEALVPRPDVAEPWVVYYFEATDAAGNGPASNGSRTSPFVERFQTSGEHRPVLLRARSMALVAIPAVVLLLLLVMNGRGGRSHEREFWIELLAPLSELRGAELARALERLCENSHYHPVRGELRIDPATAKRKLASLARTDAVALEQAHARAAARYPPAVRDTRLADDVERIEEELFWFHVLGPLMELTGPSLESELRALSTRSLTHPRLGRHYFDVPVLRTQLATVRLIDHDALLARAAVGDVEAARGGASEGASLIELLVVLALLGLVLGVTVLSMLPLVGPVERAGEQIDGLMRQARARAMTSTTVHRVRPLDADSLIVESARSCTSMAWSLEPRMQLDLEGRVTLSDTTWAVCFDGRGLASETVMMTLLHERLPPQQLELLRGGMVRWVS